MWWSSSRYKDTASSVFLGDCKSISSIMSSAKCTKKSSQEDGVRCLIDFLQHPNHFHWWQFCNVWCSILLGGKTVHQVSWQVFPHSMALFYVNSSALTLYATPPELSSWSNTLSTLHSSDHEHFFYTLSINWMTLLLSKCPKGVKFSKKRIHQSVLLFLRKAHQTSILWLATDLPHKNLFLLAKLSQKWHLRNHWTAATSMFSVSQSPHTTCGQLPNWRTQSK